MRFKFCSGLNFIFILFFLIIFSFFISPALIWYNRDKQQDLYNIYQKTDILHFNLFYCYSPKNSNRNKFNCTEIWENNSLPYKANKFILNKTFNIPITSNVRKNLSNLYLLLRVKQRDCKSGCTVLQQNAQILKWHTPAPDNSHILVSKGPKPTPKPSPTPIPYRYRTTRFDLLDNDIVNIETAPWISEQLRYSKRLKKFEPILSVDNFFDIPSERRAINMSNTNFTINVEINIRKSFIWNTKTAIQMQFDLYKKIFDTDVFTYNLNYAKRIFIGTNPILLWATGIATVLHTIFQILAFEKDVEFWTKKESLVGISLRTILLQLGGQVILFLNIAESQRFPLFIKIIQFLSILLEIWKTMHLITFSKSFPFFKSKNEYKGETDDADAAGLKYLSYGLIPLVIGYSIYQLFNVEYPSVRRYVLHCLSGAVYSFGFLAMLPQLYVNYKLKTVAGMSRSAFVYKFISTFIDDLYTFVSDLPLMYKIACFRDDVIFFVWIFQCFIYPVDPTRVNEFGYVEKTEDEKSKENDNNNNEIDENNKIEDNNEKKLKTD